ncbi:MAG: nucleotidyltransferase family protein [Candidatus Stahlbacteria bacterium]|nr:nucleotidyltransferase family protein [Candidatus Stahlbacteria bacterium]
MKIREIIRIINKNRELLNKNYSVKSIGIFGSFVRNEQKENSDIDILVEFSEPVGLKFFTLENYLSKILGAKVDLVTKGAIKPIIREDILKELIKV